MVSINNQTGHSKNLVLVGDWLIYRNIVYTSQQQKMDFMDTVFRGFQLIKKLKLLLYKMEIKTGSFHVGKNMILLEMSHCRCFLFTEKCRPPFSNSILSCFIRYQLKESNQKKKVGKQIALNIFENGQWWKLYAKTKNCIIVMEHRENPWQEFSEKFLYFLNTIC